VQRRGRHRPLPASADDGLRLRRRAAAAGAGPRLAGDRGGGELGGSAGQQGRRAEGRTANALANPASAPPRVARGAADVTGAFARRTAEIEPFLPVEVAERAGTLQ